MMDNIFQKILEYVEARTKSSTTPPVCQAQYTSIDTAPSCLNEKLDWLPTDDVGLSELLYKILHDVIYDITYESHEKDLIIKFLIEKGVTPQTFVELLLTRQNNPMDATKILSGLASAMYNHQSQSLDSQFIEPVKVLLEAGADINALEGSVAYKAIVYQFVELLLLNHNNIINIPGILSSLGKHTSSGPVAGQIEAIEHLIKSLDNQNNTRLSEAALSVINTYIFDDSVSLERVLQTYILRNREISKSVIADCLSDATIENLEKCLYFIQSPLVQEEASLWLNLTLNVMLAQESLGTFVSEPQKFIDMKYKNLNAPERDRSSIPRVIHHIWLTRPFSPKELRDEDIDNVIATHKTANTSPHFWESVVWTYRRDLVPESTRRLEENGVQVKEVSELNLSLKIPREFYKAFVEQNWGMASDILRVEIINHIGGVYMDLNYILARHLEREVMRYDYFTQTYSEIYVDNFFFGGKPHHPILEKWLSIMYANFNNPPLYIRNVQETGDIRKMTDLMTANPSAWSFYQQAHQASNVDCVYPSSDFVKYHRWMSEDDTYEQDYSHGSNDEYPENSICIADEYVRLYEKARAQMQEFATQLAGHELCLAPHLVLGEDGPNGDTWIADDL